jgi:hypothetical protein
MVFLRDNVGPEPIVGPDNLPAIDGNLGLGGHRGGRQQ